MTDFFERHKSQTLPRIKICGIRDTTMANVAIDAGADAIGVVLAVESPRFLSWNEAEKISAAVVDKVTPVAVFCNNTLDEVARWTGPVAQLHGDEDIEFINELHRRRPDLRIIKGFEFDVEAVRMWNDCDALDALLIDGSAGGHGTAFHHEKLAALMPELTKPVILAGGLAATNVGDAIRTIRPFAVDVSSGVESSRGVKDAQLIRQFCSQVARASRR